jgi:biopolymer transport protein ExbD
VPVCKSWADAMRRRPHPRRRPDPTITLINVVFLMLTFFLLAGTVAPRMDPSVRLVRLADVPPVLPPGVLAITPDGRTLANGGPVDPADWVAALPPEAAGVARILPDRDLPAAELVRIARALRVAGAESVRIVTERGLP